MGREISQANDKSGMSLGRIWEVRAGGTKESLNRPCRRGDQNSLGCTASVPCGSVVRHVCSPRQVHLVLRAVPEMPRSHVAGAWRLAQDVGEGVAPVDLGAGVGRGRGRRPMGTRASEVAEVDERRNVCILGTLWDSRWWQVLAKLHLRRQYFHSAEEVC